MKFRIAKKLCKKHIHDSKLNIVERHGRTFVVAAKPNFICSRWYIFIVVAENHERIDALIEEGKMPLKQWKQYVKGINHE